MLALDGFWPKLHRFKENLTLFDRAITLFVVGVALFVAGGCIVGFGVVFRDFGAVIGALKGTICRSRVKIIGAAGVICGLVAGSFMLVALLVALSHSPLFWEPEDVGGGC